MLTLQSKVTVPGATGLAITDFMLDCADDRYQAWWPGTHLESTYWPAALAAITSVMWC